MLYCRLYARQHCHFSIGIVQVISLLTQILQNRSTRRNGITRLTGNVAWNNIFALQRVQTLHKLQNEFGSYAGVSNNDLNICPSHRTLAEAEMFFILSLGSLQGSTKLLKRISLPAMINLLGWNARSVSCSWRKIIWGIVDTICDMSFFTGKDLNNNASFKRKWVWTRSPINLARCHMKGCWKGHQLLQKRKFKVFEI